MFGCSGGVCTEGLHVETGKGVGNRIVHTGDVLRGNGEIMYSGIIQEITQEVHDVWTVGGANVYAMDYRLIITQKSNFKGGPAVTPHRGDQDDWVQFLELDAVVGQLWRPPAI